jgi:outer membrane protein insertion porin family
MDPYFLDTRWSFSVNAFNTENDFYDFRRDSTGGELTWGYPLDFGIPYLDKVYVYLGYFGERVTIPEEAFNVILAGLETNRPRLTSSLRGTVSYDSRDNRLFPSDGYFAMLRGEWATPYLLSENDFARITAIARGYWPIQWGLVLKANLRVGYIYSPDRVPIFESYRAGGYGSIRGYYTRSIGPLERVGTLAPSNGLTYFNVGGDKDVLGNVELEFPIVEQVGIRGVLFVDVANAYGASENFFYLGQTPSSDMTGEVWDPVRDLPLGLYASTGFGIRWLSPIGPLRFEWGFPLTRRPAGTRGLPSGDEMFLFEFNIGNPF